MIKFHLDYPDFPSSELETVDKAFGTAPLARV